MRDKEELERRGEEEQLMDEKKKKKDDKKKEALLKKATEQKPKVPEPTKSGPGPPQPSIPGAPSTTAGCGVASNGGSKRSGAANGGCGGQGQALPPQAQLSATLGQQGPTTGGRYPPREVPPRFRQQEQKQLLKRGHLLSGITPQASASPALLGASCVSAVQLSSTQSSSLPPAPNKTDIGQQAVVNGLDEDCWLGGTGGVEKIVMGTGHLDVDTTGSLEARCQGKRAVGPASNHCAGNGVGANQSIGTSGMAGLASSGTGQHGTTMFWGSQRNPQSFGGYAAFSSVSSSSSSSSGASGGGDACTTIGNWKNVWATHTHGTPVLESSSWPTLETGTSSSGQFSDSSSQTGSSTTALPAAGMGSGNLSQSGSGYWSNDALNTNGSSHACGSQLSSGWTPSSIQSIDTEEQHGPNWQPGGVGGGRGGSSGSVGSDTMNIVPSLPLLSRRPKHEVPLNWAQENGPGSCRSGAQGGDGPTSLVPSSGWAIRTNGSSCFRKDLSADLPSVSEGKLSEELESNSAWEVQRLNYSCSGGKWGNAELIGICESPDDEPIGLESCTDTSNGISWGTKSGNGQQHSRVNGSDEAKEVWDGVSAQEVVKESSWGGDECMAPSVGSNESTSTGGGGGSSSNGGSGSRNCSFYRWTEHSSRTDAKTIILNVMSRTDLDPRVLSHTGWGQTPVRQDTTWDVDSLQGPGERRDCRLNGGSGEKIFAGGSNASPGVSEHGRSCKVGQTGPRFGNKGNDEQISSFSSQKNKNWEDSRTSEQRSWGNWSNNSALSWGDNQVPCSWGDTAPRNRDGWWASHNSSDSSASQNWSQDSEMSKVSSWTESPALKACDGYEDLGKARKLPQGQWTDIAGEKPQINGWEGDRVARSVSHNCSKPMPKVETTSSGVSSSWRDPGEGRPGIEVWNGDGGSPPASKLGTAVWGEPPSDGLEHTDNQEQPQSSRRCQDHEGNGQCSSAGWVGGPMPSTEAESSGWEEPPLQSLQRRTEVDDGTAAWGDPTLHRNRSVNLWDGSRVGRVELQSGDRPSRKISALAQGWRDHPKVADNGVSAWGGKPVELPENWSDTGDVNGTAVWSASVTTEASGKRGKSMQDGWPGGAEERMPQCRGWEDENDIGIWNHSAAIQDRARHNRRLPHKGNMGKSPYRPDDILIDRLIKQLTDQGFRRESAEEALRGNHLNLEMALGVLQKAEFERHGLSSALDLNGLLPRSNLLREPPLDRNPFFDKNGNQGTFARNLPPQQLSPGQPFPPSQSSLRSQVPPHFIGPQVAPAQLLQYAAKAGGLNPALLLQAPLASPQIAVFNQLAQLQLTQQRLLMQQQQQQQNLSQQSQRNPPVLRHQQEQIIRTINNLQQQQQRLAPFLPGKGHHGCNPKSVATSQCPGFTDPSSKAQKSTSYPCYSHGFADGVADCHGSEIKDKGQSRLTQWTLGPNVDGLAVDHSHGSLVAGLGKLSLDDPFHHYPVLPGGESLVSPTLPLANGWSSSKSSSSEKLSSGSASLNWPPEFHPGEPWKGLPQIDPESDPDITPGSVSFLRDRNPGVSPSSSPISTTLPSSSAWPPSASSNGYHNGYTPTYSTTGKLSEPKSSWASDTQLQGHLGNDMWQVPLPPGKSSHGPSRPPPGLASLKTPLPWIGGSRWGDQEHGHIPAAMNWSKDCASSGRASTWLVLRNLTPQIDGSTLRTLCMQHGPLITFHLSLAHGNALVCYSSREEAGKAQKSLHMCVLGNTTILAEFASDDEINRFFSQPGANLNNSGWPLPTPIHTRPTTAPSVHESSGTGGLFSPSGQWTDTEGSLLWSMPHFSSTRSPSNLPSSSARLWQCTTGNEVRRGRLPSPPPPLNNFLPGDLLGGESM